MMAEESDLGAEFRQHVVETMITVLARLVEHTGPISEDMSLMEALGLNSTLGLELMLELEDRLLILIDVEQLDQDQMKTIGDLATFIVGHSQPA